MNWLKYLVGISAVLVAGCAAYFSVTGLGVLFSGASTAVMVMAGSLEFAKLVTATYLKQVWDDIKGFNKVYLTISVAILMLITSAGIFGYLSNAFQVQSLELQRVDREVAVHQTKIDQNTAQITQLSTQITEFNQNQGKLLDGGSVNRRLIRSIDNRDKQIAKINDKISDLQTQNAEETEKINQIKISNLGLEKEVGGFRFVAEAFGIELKNVVKFFIFIIVIVFDPLAVALIIAFNGLVSVKNRKEEEILTKNVKLDEPIRQDSELMEKNYQVYGDSGKNLTEEEKIPILVENIRIPIDSDGDGNIDGWDTDGDGMINEWIEIGPRNGVAPYYARPEFDWNNKNAWINDQNAVNFWLKYKKQ
jgi:cell division protein FtsL